MARKEDKCRIEVQGELTMERFASLQMLYFPLIGSDACILYQTLLSIGTRNQKIKNHILIQKLSNLSMEVMEKSRHILEQYLLVKTFYDALNDAYIYQIFMPKDGQAFLRHEVFGRLYMKEMGKQVYEFNKLSFASNVEDKKTYQDITIPFVNNLKEDWEDSQEEMFKKMKPKSDILHTNELPLSFNFDRFLSDLSESVFPNIARNEKNLRMIGELATIHGIDELEMRKLVSKSMDVKDNTLKIEVLKKKVRESKSVYVEKEHAHPYGVPPVRFLQNKQHGIEVSRGDKQVIETLISDFKMKPEVVNVLIEYVLQTRNQQFSKAYVEKIAGTWVRLEIDTYEKALAHIQEEQKGNVYYAPTKAKELPAWYANQDSVQVDTNDFDEAKLAEKLKKLRGE
ncbi:MAG: DnaD domain protein [Longicatena sp.]